MIVKGRKTKRFRWLDIVLLFVPALGFSSFFLLEGLGWKNDRTDASDKFEVVFRVDLETTDGPSFVYENYSFEGASQRSDQFAHSGLHSVMNNADQAFSLSTWYEVKDARRLRLSVWRYSPDGASGWLVASAEDSEDFYASTDVSGRKEGPWELLSLDLNVPPDINRLKLYCFVDQPDDRTVYFDDFQLQKVPILPDYESVALSELLIDVSPTGMRQLEAKRDQAWQRGILESDRSDWVDARITYKQESYAGRLRLKGDWLDHLEGDKWSFRIKLQDGAIDGKQVFSVQSPHTRSFLHEWQFHELLAQENILSPSYDFVKLKLNGKILGTYAMEEHFVKSLVEHRDRREGPIVKLSEEDFWDSVKRVKDIQKADPNFVDDLIGDRAFYSSKIESFEEENTQENERLAKQTERAYAMLAAYKYNSPGLHNIIDPVRTGKYLAIVDLTQANHGLSWHNQRWYYNPVSDLLEPIGFDGYDETLILNPRLLTDQVYNRGTSIDPYRHLFFDAAIMEQYGLFLKKLCDTDYLDKFERQYEAKIAALREALEAEYATVHHDPNRLKHRLNKLRTALPPKANALGISASSKGTFSVINSHSFPLQITAYRAEGNLIRVLDPPIFVTPNTFDNKPHSISLPEGTREIFYTLIGGAETDKATLSPLQIRTPVWREPDLVDIQNAGFEIIDTEIIVPNCTITDPLLVPSGYRLIFPEGTTLNLKDNGYLLSYSPIEVTGSSERPVVFASSDGTGAFAVIDARNRSGVTHARFNNLGTIDDQGYVLTGGVTFYNSPVVITNSVFADSKEEDALNVVNSTISIAKCLFANTAFDALDSDFCDGEIQECVFRNTGNDALDFSGSMVKLSNIQMEHIGDKGISAGEHSRIRATGIEITDAKMGAVSKDLSELTIESISLHRVRQGFAAYRKKIDFGPATLIVFQYNAHDVRQLKMVEEGSQITLENLEE